MHTSIPFSDYFDPRLLHDLANELQVQIVSCNSEGLRYAFILDRGQLAKLPTHIDFPFIENGTRCSWSVSGRTKVIVIENDVSTCPPSSA